MRKSFELRLRYSSESGEEVLVYMEKSQDKSE